MDIVKTDDGSAWYWASEDTMLVDDGFGNLIATMFCLHDAWFWDLH